MQTCVSVANLGIPIARGNGSNSDISRWLYSIAGLRQKHCSGGRAPFARTTLGRMS